MITIKNDIHRHVLQLYHIVIRTLIKKK